MHTFSSRGFHLLVGALAAAGCTGKPVDTGTEDTGPVAEPEVYTVSDGVPTSSGEWRGQLEYSRVHPYSWGTKGPELQIERLTSSASFFAAARAGVFDVSSAEGCWTDEWTPGWAERLDIGESLAVQVGAETATHTPTDVSDGVLYTWRAETPAQDWAIAPGTALTLDGTATGVTVPEPLEIKNLAGMWSTYDGDEEGMLPLEWEPPTMGDTWIHLLRREEAGGYTHCHVRDDGAVTIDFGSRRDRNEPRLFIARVSTADVEHPTLGRTHVYAEDLVLLDPG